MDGTIRVKTAGWFATAVVLSVFATVLVMQTWRVDAAPGDSDSTFVPITPCRLFDYRPGELPAGGKKLPLAAGSPATQQVTGTVGNCVIPVPGVVGVAMNVTVLNGTAQSNLRLYPADAGEPLVSNMNWKAGDSPTANKVDVKLSPAGAIKLANFSGSVNVIGDIVGYYTDETLKELAATAGAPGPQGPTGPRGFSAWDTIPSGVTVTGSITWDTHVIADNATHRINVALPGKAPVPLTSNTVNFADDTSSLTLDDDAACTGSGNFPTAPPGKVCLYRVVSFQVDNLTGEPSFNAADGFYITVITNGTSEDMFLDFSWAYTAP